MCSWDQVVFGSRRLALVLNKFWNLLKQNQKKKEANIWKNSSQWPYLSQTFWRVGLGQVQWAAICERQVPYVQPWCLAKIGCAHLSVGLKQCTIDSVASTFLPAFRPFSVSSWSRLNCFGAKTTSSRILSLKCSTNHWEKFSLVLLLYLRAPNLGLTCWFVMWRFG